MRNEADTVVSETEYIYDENALLPADLVTGWTSPPSSYRGNVTTTKRRLDLPGPTTTWLETHVQYDKCGNVRNIWDAKDVGLTNPSQISYIDAFSGGSPSNPTYAFPTTTTSAVPDSNGTYGQTTGLVSTTVYDFNTGLVTSATDANNRTTTFEYNDPLNRLKKVNRPDGSWTTTDYHDDPGNIHQVTKTLQQSSPTQVVLESYQYFDNLGRSVRSFANEGTTYLTSDTQYDKLGRVWRVSTPYRTTAPSINQGVNPAGKWTTNTYDYLSRVRFVTAPDSSQAATEYGYSLVIPLGATVTATDPTAKKRKSITDAGGRLIQVIEDPSDPNVAYESNYTYDALNNLTLVSQGAQTRTFVYDSLSRLRSATNPESGRVCYGTVIPSTNQCQPDGYDANGNLIIKTDARGVRSTYGYDALNRNTTITYTDDPAGTPSVTRTYDSAANGKGRLRKTETSGSKGSRTTINAYDDLGRPLSKSQQFMSGGVWSAPFTVGANYDKAGHVLTLTYPSGHTANYGYDVAGRTSSFTGNLGEGVPRTYANEFQYSELGGLQQEKFGTDTPLYHKQQFNERGQLWDMRLSSIPFATDPGNGDRGAVVNYYSDNFAPGGSNNHNNGNLLRQEIHIPGSNVYQDNFAYDSLNRLKSISENLNGNPNETFKQAYTYDRWGNRTIDQANTTANVPHPEYTVDPANNNRLLAPPGYTHEYDDAGNQKRDTYTTNSPTAGYRTFDAENRIIEAQKPASWKVPWAYYTYDGDGLRVRRKIATFEIWQVYGFGGELLAEYPQTGPSVSIAQPQKEYGYRNGQLLVTAEPFTNLAWNKPATQYDNLAPATTADKAVDGDVDGDLANGHLAATNSHNTPWWQVELGSVQNISSITVWGRTDCCPEMSSDFYVFVSDVPFWSYDFFNSMNQPGVSYYFHAGFSGPGSGSGPTSININRTGRFVRVYLPAFNSPSSLALAEVQVWSAAAKLEWLVTDQLGTPRMVVDKTGALAGVTRHDYLPFGEEIGGPQVALIGGRTTDQGYIVDSVRQHFTGYEADPETGLNYAQARYQSTLQGRFVSVDPLGASASVLDPQSFNRYSYVNNNPTNLTDPTGMMAYDASNSYTNAFSTEAQPFDPNRSHFGGPAILFAAGLLQNIAVGGGIQNRHHASRASHSQKRNWLGEHLSGAVDRAVGLNFVTGVAGDSVTVSGEVTGISPQGGRAPVSATGGRGNTVIITYSDGSQEVRSGGSRSWRNNNPGNIRPDGNLWGEIGSAGGFGVFSGEAEGEGAMSDLLLRPRYQAQTVFGAIAMWAPPADNNDTAAYQRRVEELTRIPGQTRMNTLNQDQLRSVVGAIRTIEGWRVGTVNFVEPRRR